MEKINICNLVAESYEWKWDNDRSELNQIITSFVVEEAPAEQTRQALRAWVDTITGKLDGMYEDAIRQHKAQLEKPTVIFGTEV